MKQSSLAGLQTLIAIKDKELKLMKKKLLFTTALGFTMTGGTINIETSAESHAAIGSEGKDGAINIEGGIINVDGGIDVRNSQLKGSNYMQGSKINLSGGELNINSGANLKTFIGEDINNKSTINLTDDGTINLAGGLPRPYRFD